MPTVLRKGNLRVVIYTDDHPPPHVHVFGDGETKVAIVGAEVIHTAGTTLPEARRARRIVQDHQAYLLARWSELHD